MCSQRHSLEGSGKSDTEVSRALPRDMWWNTRKEGEDNANVLKQEKQLAPEMQTLKNRNRHGLSTISFTIQNAVIKDHSNHPSRGRRKKALILWFTETHR